GIFRPPPGNDRSRHLLETVALYFCYRLHLFPRGSGLGWCAVVQLRARRRCLAGEADGRGHPAGRAGNVYRQDAGLPRPQFHRRRPDARASGCAAAVRVERHVMHGLSFDIAHMLAGLLVLVSFLMLYQDRLYALLHVLALHALVLAASVGWQAYIQNAPHLYITA